MFDTFKIAGLASTIALTAGALDAQTLRFAHAAPESDMQQDLAEFFAEEVEARTDGDISVQVFPQGQLGTDSGMIDGVRSGIIDIVMVGLNNFTGLMPEAAAFTLPFMFPDRDAAYSVLDGEVGQGVLDDMEEFGIVGLGYPENGFRNMTNNERPISEPADVEDLRMRVNNSRALNDMFQILGASPQQIPVAELYTALETGVVNAQDHPIGIVQSFAFYEVQDYLSLTQHAYAPLVVVMNQNTWDGLSEENQEIVQTIMDEAVDMQRQMSIDGEDEMIATLEEEGMEVNRDVDTAAFQEAIQPVYDSFIEQNGDELLNAIQDAIPQNDG